MTYAEVTQQVHPRAGNKPRAGERIDAGRSNRNYFYAKDVTAERATAVAWQMCTGMLHQYMF